ncbi:hypothetical protein M9Y10_007599 [Tritrichomonas musculus]|uniref:protein-serine/threonine phosphatase n=1 Tax=Tritrichomonas musculus TaxID=1915356 RepID=A0ABR2J409_9EUKA
MFLGTRHNKLRGQKGYDTVAVEATYNLFNSNKKLVKDVHLPIERDNLTQILSLAKSCLLEDPTVLRIKPRLHVIGDLKGNYNHIWKMISTNEPTDKFLFLGDYVNYGKHSLENITFILCMKLLAPKQIFLLRGEQETPEMTEKYGFKEECFSRFDEDIYNQFLEVFECLPLAAIAKNDKDEKSILFLNGGLSPNLFSIAQLDAIQRPIKNVEDGLVHEILFSDPSPTINKFEYNKNVSHAFYYGSKAVHQFLKDNNLDQIIRSHQKNDFRYPFGDDQSVLSIYSANGMNLLIREDMLYTFSKISDSTFEYRNNNVFI